MRFLFLDFDGVLNSNDFLPRRKQPAEFAQYFTDEKVQWAASSIDPLAVQRLDRVVSLTNARVVVSSSWRTLFPLTQLQRLLSFHGFTHPLLSATPDSGIVRYLGLAAGIRGNEILAWLRLFDPNMIRTEDIVIVDDDADMGGYTDRLVQTSYDHGLQDLHIDRIINLYA